MTLPKVIVLILSYNGKNLLDDSVSSYLANDYSNFEVMVIDNGSVDGSKEYVEEKYPRAKVIRIEKNKGYSGGFNVGLDYAFKQMKADFVLITNNDVKADKSVISELVKLAETDAMIGFVTGKVYFYDAPDTLQTVGKAEDPIRWNGEHIGNREKDLGQYDEIRERVFLDDIFTLVRKELFFQVGGYDTEFFLQAEEYDWQARAKEKGYKFFYTPHAKIWHKESMTIGKDSSIKAYFDSRNPMIVILKYKSASYFRTYLWQHFKRGVFRRSLVVTKNGFRIKTASKIWFGFFSALIWGIRHRSFSLRHFFNL